MPLGAHYLPQEFGFVVIWQKGLIITCGGYVWACLKNNFRGRKASNLTYMLWGKGCESAIALH